MLGMHKIYPPNLPPRRSFSRSFQKIYFIKPIKQIIKKEERGGGGADMGSKQMGNPTQRKTKENNEEKYQDDSYSPTT